MLGIIHESSAYATEAAATRFYDLKLTCRSLIADPVHHGYNTSW
jgi:hypothetical protein